jgi:hypothetical protein
MQHEKVLNMFEKFVLFLSLFPPPSGNNECNNEKNDYSFEAVFLLAYFIA